MGASGITQTSKVAVINTWGTTAAQIRTRTTARGTSQRMTIDIKSDPIGIVTDPKLLGAPVAEAIRVAIRAGIMGIDAVASSATIARRKSAYEHQSSSWVQKRYGGGRIGWKPPDPHSVRLFNDSTRLRDGLSVRYVGEGSGAGKGGGNDYSATWTINLPVNRFNPATFGTGLEAVLARFFSLVPVLADPTKLATDPAVVRAGNQLVKEMTAVGKSVAEVLNKAAALAAKLFRLGDFRDSEAPEDRPQDQPAAGR